MNHLIQVSHNSDVYEILFSPTIIIRITKFLGDRGYSRQVAFDDLPNEVKQKVMKELNHAETQPP